ncbi:MAG: sugar kinase [Pseudomonadota bacterium]
MFDLRHPTRPRLICLGLSAFDVTWVVESLPSGGGKTRALDLREGGGGMAANASVAAAKLGAQVQFWGRAGQDSAGRSMHQGLAALGVDVSQFRLFDGARSSVSGIIVDANGERAIVNFRGADLPDDPAWLPLDAVAQADAVLADPRWPEGALALFQTAQAHQVATVLDGDVAEAPVFDALLPFVDCAVFSEPALAGYATQAGDVEAQLHFARSRGCALAAVTLGERGVVWVDATGTHRLPALKVDAVDTTGAGDVFHGAFAFALGAQVPLREAFQFSSVVAALKCRHAGGREGVPDLATALSSLQRFKELSA